MAGTQTLRRRKLAVSPVMLMAPVLMMLALIVFSGSNLGEQLDLMFRDGLFRLRHAHVRQVDERLLFVGIDDQTLAALKARWPFDRSTHGAILGWLGTEEPGVVGWDVLFSEKANGDEDKNFVAGLKALNAPAVFASSIASERGGEKLTSFSDKRRGLTEPLTRVIGDISQVREVEYGLMPIQPLMDNARFGFIHDKRDSDGVKRRSFLLHRIDGRIYPNLALQMLLSYHHVSMDEVEIEIGKEIRIESETFTRVIPINVGGEFDVNYRYTIQDVPNCSYVKLQSLSKI